MRTCYNLFPTADSDNLVICVESPGGKKPFSCLITDKIADLHLMEAAQCFPLYYYREKDDEQAGLFGDSTSYRKEYAITDRILRIIRSRFGEAKAISKETIFYYVYGLLHSPDYRQRFNDDLKKQLPRIPIAESAGDFIAFAEAGRKLAESHLNYEKQPPLAGVEVAGRERGNYRVEKMKFAGKPGAWDKSRIIYNSDIEISGVPARAYEYAVNGRSAIEWIMESYRIKTDKDSGIVNDPNLWAAEHGEPDYILRLLLSVVSLSMKTLDIVEKLPKLEFGE